MKNNKKIYSVALTSASIILFFILFTSTAAAELGVPYVTSISPNQGAVGTEVTIKGYNFTGVTEVDFGGYPSKYQIISDSEIKADAPAAFGTVIIEVINSLHESNGPQVVGTYYYTDGGSIVSTNGSVPTSTSTSTQTHILNSINLTDVIVALIGLLGAITIAYFGYLAAKKK